MHFSGVKFLCALQSLVLMILKTFVWKAYMTCLLSVSWYLEWTDCLIHFGSMSILKYLQLKHVKNKSFYDAFHGGYNPGASINLKLSSFQTKGWLDQVLTNYLSNVMKKRKILVPKHKFYRLHTFPEIHSQRQKNCKLWRHIRLI